MSDTTIVHGNDLASAQLQPGWTIEQDGFGLVQVQAKFKWDAQYADQFTSEFVRGVTLAPEPFTYCVLWKANMIIDKTGVATVTADYVGIDQTITGEDRSYPQIAATAGSSSQPIEAHPNFLRINATYGGLTNVLANYPPSAGGFDPSTSTNPNRALWTPKVANQGATQGFQFVGFLPNQTAAEVEAGNINIKAGIKNYYKPQLTLRVLQYLGSEEEALTMASYVGWTNNGSLFNLPESYINLATPGSYPGNPTYDTLYESKINPGYLCTSCSVELFGSIYKVTTELMLSGIAGWDNDIYPHLVD
jgi:hypothetical protein